MTGDEKWILYNNVERKRSWDKRNEPPPTTPKAGHHPKKVMLCIWWDWKGVLYYELLPENQTINSNKYCSQLDQLKAALDEKRPELVNRKHIIFHQDKARLYVSLMTRQKLLQLGWEVQIHPPYSPDIVPSDFRLFWSLQNSFFLINLFFFNLFLAALGPRCCVQAFSSCSEQGLFFVVVCGLLIAVASLVAEHGL